MIDPYVAMCSFIAAGLPSRLSHAVTLARRFCQSALSPAQF